MSGEPPRDRDLPVRPIDALLSAVRARVSHPWRVLFWSSVFLLLVPWLWLATHTALLPGADPIFISNVIAAAWGVVVGGALAFGIVAAVYVLHVRERLQDALHLALWAGLALMLFLGWQVALESVALASLGP